MRTILLTCMAILATTVHPALADGVADPPPLRVATFNVALWGPVPGATIERLSADDAKARKLAAVIQHVRPDLLLLNEFDFDAEGRGMALFTERYLGVGQFGQAPIDYPHRFAAPVNTGVPSGLDLDGDGHIDGPADAWGYGMHPGQYGMLVLSRYPIDTAAVHTFQHLRWASMPGALRPALPDGTAFYSDEIWAQLRLSSKSHWDVPVDTPQGRVHFLVAHPTPPVFDGPEDRNGRRNHDEIRLWAEYIASPDAGWLCDDQGRCGGLPTDARFVIAGDMNADPVDGESHPGAIARLLDHPRVLRHAAPRSEGAALAGRSGDANQAQRGDHAEDTGAFSPRVGNLRADYVLPSVGWRIVDSGVFWPRPGEPGSDWLDASDHHMVWLDLRAEPR